jgi:hypothetical protein
MKVKVTRTVVKQAIENNHRDRYEILEVDTNEIVRNNLII